MSAPDSGLVRSCGVCTRIAGTLVRESNVFGARIMRGESPGAGMQICPDHVTLVVAVTAPRQLAAWLLAGAEAGASPTASCYLCEAAARAESDALRDGGGAGVSCSRHGPEKADPREVGRMRDLLARIAAGERMPRRDEAAALRAALIQRFSIHGSKAHVPKIE